MKELDKLSGVENEDDTLDVLVDLARTCLQGINAEVGDSEELDDLLDLQTCYKVIEVCGGVKLNDPNLIAAAMDMAQQNGQT